jgi:hypothetical protein
VSGKEAEVWLGGESVWLRGGAVWLRGGLCG